MFWLTVIVLSIMILRQDYELYPDKWKNAWYYLKSKIGV